RREAEPSAIALRAASRLHGESITMLDAAFDRDNLEVVKLNCANRNVTVDVDAVIRHDDERKRLQQQADETKAKQNEISKKFPQAKTPEEKQALKDES